MKHLGFFSGIVVALLLVLSMWYFYSESKGGAKMEVLQVQAQPGGDRGGRGGAGGGDRGGRGGFDRGAMFGGGFGGMTRTPGQQTFEDLIEILAYLNLDPGFELTKAQKESLKQIRDGFKEATDKWRKEKEPEFTKLLEQVRAAGRDGFRDFGEKRQAIMATAPSADAAIEQIRQLLTAEQIKAVDDKVAARKAEQEERRKQMEERMQNRGGQGGQGGQGGGRQRGGNAPAGGGNAPAPAPQ